MIPPAVNPAAPPPNPAQSAFYVNGIFILRMTY